MQSHGNSQAATAGQPGALDLAPCSAAPATWPTACPICGAPTKWKISGRGKHYGQLCEAHGFVAIRRNPILGESRPVQRLTLWQRIGCFIFGLPNMDIAPPIVADLISEDVYLSEGRGSVHIVRNPRDTHGDDRWGWLINHRVRLDGRIVEVLAVESYCIHGLYPAGRPIGIIVREVNDEDTVI